MDARTRSIALALLGKADSEIDAYYLALGKFIAQYAVVESALRGLLWKISGVKEPIAQAVLSGVRTEEAISYVNRIADAERWDENKKAEFKVVFDQIQAINKFRNEIVHRGATLQTDGSWLSTNKAIAHIPERVTNTPVSATILDQARNDLFYIRAALLFLPSAGKVREGLHEWARIALDGAWQYKPAPQGRKASMNRRNRQKQQPRHQSSRA